MSNVLLHDDADRVPAPPSGRHPHTLISGADFGRRSGLPWQVWGIVMLAVLLPLLWLLWRVDGLLTDLAWRWPWLVPLVGLVMIVCVLVLLVLGVAWAWLRLQQARLIRSRLGVPVDVLQQLQLSPYVLEQQAIDLELVRAQYGQYPYLSTLSSSLDASQKSELLRLGDAVQQLRLASSSEWRAWLREASHLLISGPTNAGKTTLARALLPDLPGRLLVLDPHDQVEKWPVPAIGGGRDYAAIYVAIAGLLDEMNQRFKRLQQGEQHFTPLTVLIDEAPAVALHNPQRWQYLTSRLTSEARKVNVKLLILGQSHLVRDLGLSSLLRRNLGLVALGPQASDLVNEEREPGRRTMLVNLLRGSVRSAAFAYRGEVQILDMADVPALAAAELQLNAWCPSVRPSDLPDSDSVRPSVRLSDAERDRLIVRLKNEGKNREEIRSELQSYGIGLPNKEYSLIMQRLEVA